MNRNLETRRRKVRRNKFQHPTLEPVKDRVVPREPGLTAYQKSEQLKRREKLRCPPPSPSQP